MVPGLTPVQQKMYAVLMDGLLHSKEELFRCLHDDLGDLRNVFAHITTMRKVLNRRGEEVQCVPPVAGRKTAYRLVRLMASAVDGKR